MRNEWHSWKDALDYFVDVNELYIANWWYKQLFDLLESLIPKDSDAGLSCDLGSSRRTINRHWTCSYITSSDFESRRWARARFDQTSDERCCSLLRKHPDSFCLHILSSTISKGITFSYRDESIRLVSATEPAEVRS